PTAAGSPSSASRCSSATPGPGPDRATSEAERTIQRCGHPYRIRSGRDLPLMSPGQGSRTGAPRGSNHLQPPPTRAGDSKLGMDQDAIAVEGLEKSYGSVKALCGVDLRARTGTVLGLLGPNGAGKTTAVRILATLLQPDGGTARVAGLAVVNEAAAARA